MKLNMQHFGVRPAGSIETWVASKIFAFTQKARIDMAHVRLEHLPEASPSYRVHLHLETPGPDYVAEARDHTLRAAFEKAVKQIRNKIADRALKRLRRRKEKVRLRREG